MAKWDRKPGYANDKHVFSVSFLYSCPCVMSLTVTLNPTSCKKPTLSQKPCTSAHVCLEGGAQTRAWASCCLSLWLPHTPPPPLIPPLQTQRQTTCVSLALSDWQPKESVSWRKPSFGLTSILSHETLLWWVDFLITKSLRSKVRLQVTCSFSQVFNKLCARDPARCWGHQDEQQWLCLQGRDRAFRGDPQEVSMGRLWSMIGNSTQRPLPAWGQGNLPRRGESAESMKTKGMFQLRTGKVVQVDEAGGQPRQNSKSRLES